MATSSMLRPLAVIAGVGNATGTGAATARLLSKHGYSLALVARGAGSLRHLADEIKDAGGEAEPFPILEYSPEAISEAFSSIRNKFSPSSADANGRPLRVAIFNAAQGVFKPFLDVTPQDIRETLEVNVTTAFTFARESILDFKRNDIADGKRGTIIFTGATAALRGNVMTSVFAAGKHGQRALSQSLAKEFGKDNIHVAHTIIDGQILTDRTRSYNDAASDWETNDDVRLSPESIASAYLYLVNQDRSAWTWELDLRPAHEKW